MFSDVQIINLGLSKIGSVQIQRIDPPRTSLERFVASGYVHWKRSEISKRRWVFAWKRAVNLAQTETLEGEAKPHVYQLPSECLRPVRRSGDEWEQTGRYLHSAHLNLRVDYVANPDEAEFDPLFVEVLACRVAAESAEYVTQSNTKKADAQVAYQQSVADAAKNNAFVIGPENVADDDSAFPFLTDRL